MPTVIQPPWQTGYPVLLSDSITLDLTAAAGVTKQLNSQRLSNTYNTAVAIDELRFYVRPTAPAVTTGAATIGSHFDFGSFITAFCSVNGLHLMQNAVHLRSLGTLWQSDLTYGGYQKGFAGPTRHFTYPTTFFRWVFPEPLWIGRQGALDIRVAADAIASRPNDPSVDVPNVTVYVAALGRLQPVSQPQMVAYPYVAEYASTGITARAGTAFPAFAMASDPVFRNPFMNPITIERITNSLYLTSTNVGRQVDMLSNFPDPITMRLTDSRGNAIGGASGSSPIPLGGFIDPRTGDWTINRILDAYQFMYLELYANTDVNFGTQPIWYPRVAFSGTHLAELVP